MAGLLYRELILCKKNLIGMALGVIPISLLMFAPIIFDDDNMGETSTVTALFSAFVFVMIFIMFGMMTSSIFEADESKKWAYFITSTPLTDVSQIKEKYIFALLLYVGLFVWCIILAYFMAALGGGAANAMIAFMMMCIMLLTNAIEFPFIVRFGSKAGSNIKTALTVLLLVIAFEYIFFGDLSIFGSIDTFFEFIERLSDTSAMADIALVLMAVFPYFTLGLYYLSYKISCKLYLKGAEEYER